MQLVTRTTRHFRHLLLLAFLTAAMGTLVVQHGGVNSSVTFGTGLATGLVGGIFFLMTRRSDLAPPLSREMRFGLIALFGFVLFQLIPLPIGVIERLVPARGELTDLLQSVVGHTPFAPLTISATATFEHATRLGMYLVVFLLVREIAWSHEANPAVTILPLVGIAMLEAGAGISQYVLSSGSIPATGSYVNRNHFAGLLQLVLPFAVVQCCGAFRRTTGLISAAELCFWALASSLLFVGIMCSLSRMAATASLVSSALVLALFLRTKVKHLAVVIPLIAVAFIVLSPVPLINRFNEFRAATTTDTRIDIWSNSLDVLSDFPILGCGLGSFATAFAKYKTVIPDKTVEFAHNDYLQLVAELGVVGMIPLILLIVMISREAIISALRGRDEAQRVFGAGCAASLCSIALSSFVDFNLYIPANAVVLAWIAGITTTLQYLRSETPELKRAPQTSEAHVEQRMNMFGVGRG